MMPISVPEGTWGAKKRGKVKLSFPTCKPLLNSSNSGRGTEGTHLFRFSYSDFASTKVPWDITFLPRIIHEPANSSKKHHGRHELGQREYCPEDGRDGSQERGEGFGDVQREKISKSVSTEDEDQLEPRRASK